MGRNNRDWSSKLAYLFVMGLLVGGFALVILIVASPLVHAVYWQCCEVKPTPSLTPLEKTNAGIHEASAPPIVESVTNNDVSPSLTGYIYEFPDGTVDFKQVISSTVVREGEYHSAVAYNDIVVTYLCLMIDDVNGFKQGDFATNNTRTVWRTCQPVIRKAE